MANTDKELISDAITTTSSITKEAGKNLEGVTNIVASFIKNTGKNLGVVANVTSSFLKNTGKNLGGLASATPSFLKSTGKNIQQIVNTSGNLKKSTNKKIIKTATATGTIKKSTNKKLNNSLTVTATKEVNDATVTLYYNGNAKLGLGAEQGAKFDIIVSGTFTTFSITINGKTLIYTETVTAQTITIDNVNATCKNVTVNKMSNLTGDVTEFLTLLPGYNTVTYHKEGGSVDFTFDFRAQYI